MRVVRNVGDPIERPLGPEVGVAEIGGLVGLAVVVSHSELDRRAHWRSVAERLVPKVQTDQHEMHAGHRHTYARFWWSLGIIVANRIGIVAWVESLAPDRRAFLFIHGPPALGEFPWRNQKVAAGFCVQGLFGRPHIISKSRVFQQIPVTLLPDQRGVMADLPVNNGWDQQRTARLPESHLIVQPDLCGQVGDLR